MPRQTPRLIDLHIDWFRQYAPETELFGAESASAIEPFLSQVEGYLGTTSAAVIALGLSDEDRQRQSDPWRSLGNLIARVEAEFSGRILMTSDDVDRWRDDPHGLSWAMVGVAGFDTLIRSSDDLAYIRAMFDRGVRVFQPISGPTSLLGGSVTSPEDQGLTPLGRSFLESLVECSRGAAGSLPALDLALMNSKTMEDTLDWFDAEPSRQMQVVPIDSLGTTVREGFASCPEVEKKALVRLRRLRGYIGLSVGPPFPSDPRGLLKLVEEISAIPFGDQAGCEGICIGTNLLHLSTTFEGLGNASEIRDWVFAQLPETTARAIIHDNASLLIERLTGR